MNPIILAGCMIVKDDEIYLLYRNKHNYYELPGGKVDLEDCKDPENPSEPELEANALRELDEECTGNHRFQSINYFGKVEFTIPDGRQAISHAFLIEIKGTIGPKETIFDQEKSKWIKINELENEPIAPNLKLFLPKLISLIQK